MERELLSPGVEVLPVIHFKRFVQGLGNGRTCCEWRDDKALDVDLDTVREAVRHAQEAAIFVMDRPDLGVLADSCVTYINDDLPLSMPFPVSWFEWNSKDNWVVPGGAETVPIGCLVIERSPNIVDVWVLEAQARSHEGGVKVGITLMRGVPIELLPTDQNSRSDMMGKPFAQRTMLMFVSALRGGQIGEERVHDLVMFRDPAGRKRRPVEIRRIIRVVPKRMARESVAPIASRIVSWSHAFDVRGHWRRIDGLGKDRSGEYCVNGFTWVRPHVKKDDLPYVKKVRYVVGRDVVEDRK